MTGTDAGPGGRRSAERRTGETGQRREQSIRGVRRRAVSALRHAAGPAGVLAMAVAGLGVAGYLTAVHYANVPLACSTTGVVDCSAVTTSAYSVVPGTSVPITVPGMLWFAVSGLLAGLALRRRPEPAWLGSVHAGWSLLGLGAALYLVFVEVVRLHRLCEWCTAVHVLIAATFLCTLARLLSVADDDALAG